ncbi:hypothetical protein ABFX02_08G169100 [Erythranthe guttata]
MTGHTLPYDEYLWIQYGKRVVGGNDFPVRYYRCSYPGCTVRKKCVRSPTGEITEIVYRDSHHHPKPHLIDIDLSFATRDGNRWKEHPTTSDSLLRLTMASTTMISLLSRISEYNIFGSIKMLIFQFFKIMFYEAV